MQTLSIEGGSARRSGRGRRRRSRLQGHPLRRPAARTIALAAAATGFAVGRRSPDERLRPEFAAGSRFRRHRSVRLRRVGGLPLSQRLDADGAGEFTTAAGHGLDSRRRLRRRIRFGAALRRDAPRRARHRRRHAEPPPQCAGLPRASRTDGRIRTSRLRKLRHARSRRRARMGEAQHRGLRRRSRPSDDRRRIRRLRSRQHADGLAARQRPFRPGDRRKRRNVRNAEPRAGAARQIRGGRPRLHAQGRREDAGRSCARRPPTPFWPPRPASVTARSSTATFCPGRPPGFSRRTSSPTCR